MLVALALVRPDEQLVVSVSVMPHQTATEHKAIVVLADSHAPAKGRVVHSVGVQSPPVHCEEAETGTHARAWPVDHSVNHALAVVRQRDAAAVGVLRDNVTDDIVRHTLEVAGEILADGGDCLPVLLATTLIACVRQPVGVRLCPMRPLQQEQTPCPWLVQMLKHHVQHRRVELMLVVLTSEPRTACVGLRPVLPSILPSHPVVAVARDDAGSGVKEVVEELRSLIA